jgi:hypothetical protein
MKYLSINYWFDFRFSYVCCKRNNKPCGALEVISGMLIILFRQLDEIFRQF